MKKIAVFLTGIVASLTSITSYADDHGIVQDRPVEIWTCNFQEGKSMVDVDAWYDAMNKNAETMKNNKFNSFIWTPNFVGDLKSADIALTFSFESLTSMGTTMDEFFSSESGATLFAQFQATFDCSSREVWLVTQKRNAG